VKKVAGTGSGAGSSGNGEFDEIAMRQMIIDVVRQQIPLEMPAPAAAPAEGGGAPHGIDEPRLRMMIRAEVAEIIAELPQPPTEHELSQLIDGAVDEAMKDQASAEPAPAAAGADGPAPGETGVFVSKMRTIVEQLLAEKMQDRATHAEVDKVVTRRLEASSARERPAPAEGGGLTAAQVKQLIRAVIDAELCTRDEIEKMIERGR